MSLDCIATDWKMHIGDPDLHGWIITIAYLVASLFCFRVVLQSREVFYPGRSGAQRLFWLSLSLILLILCVNKQLDLQQLITTIGRCMAKEGGWLEDRRMVQQWFVIGLVAAGVVFLLLLIPLMRGAWLINLLALTGLGLIFQFAAVRAASMHHVDLPAGITTLDTQARWVVELSGIVIVAVAALLRPLKRGALTVQ